jgi:hypothetical protein
VEGRAPESERGVLTFSPMVQPDLRLERQGDALVVHAKHRGRWVGVLVGGFGLYLIWRVYGIEMPDQGAPVLVAYWFGLLIGVMPASFGVFLLPREVTTTFDLSSRRVVHHVRMGRGWYEHRRTYAFTEIAGLSLTGYDAESDSYMPAMALQNGKTRWLSTANGSYLICAMTIEAICAETGLHKLGAAR